ncbi:MAG: CRISPR-associated protein Csx3 [Gammaproteobacteria bacterium]|nr:MAG: CRISPR-associated protein Csx3 [Gammaproteobacteria bacterium]
MSCYRIDIDADNILKVGFGDPAANNQIIRDAGIRLDKLIQAGELGGGKLLKVNGPASMPVAMLLGHKLAHLYETVACYDPKLGCYVVVSAHGGGHRLGDSLT